MSDLSIERYVPQGDLSTRGERELAAVGLSTAFPARMRELNDGLTYLSRGTFAGLRFNLRPDENFPVVDVEARYLSPYRVSVEAGLNKKARLSLSATPGQLGMLAMLALHQVQAFTDAYPTDNTMVFSAIPRQPDKLHRGRQLLAVTGESFAAVTSRDDLEQLGIVASRYDLTVGFKAEAAELALAMSYVDERRADTPTFMMRGFTATDSSANIEAVTGLVGNLLKQNWNVPGGPEA